jgi:LuxR family maltose regulon positive regulatory protein
VIDQLLTTKLYIPPVREKRVSRTRLLQRLDEGLGQCVRLMLVSGPAGFGKTTLLAEWSNLQSQIPNLKFAWLSLDEHDNDLARFWSYVIAALQTVQADVGQAAQAMLRATPPAPLEAVLTSLINDAAAHLPLCVLVLDDYHVIESRPIHESLSFLLDHLPPQLRLVIATRADPPFALSQLRARQQMIEVRADGLRFAPDEATAFLNHVMGLGLAEADVAALEARTEGWIAGLQMAALSMRGRKDVSSFIAAFTGAHRYILDYLADQVLEREPEHVQAFLLETAILDRFTGSLCDAVTGRSDGQAMLERLEDSNLFVVLLDDERQWYRYHRLFADLLRARLHAASVQPEHVAELHRRASAWYSEHGDAASAVAHALAAKDMTRVVALIEAHSFLMLLRGELSSLLSWIAALPEDMVLANPRVCVYHAWTLLLTGQLAQIESRLQSAERCPLDHADKNLLGHIATIRAYVASMHGDMARAVELARLALERLDVDDQAIRAVAWFTLGGACLMQDDLEGMHQAMSQAAAMGRASGNIHIALPALNSLAGLQRARGQLHQAQSTCQTALRLATLPAGSILPIAGGALAGLAELYYEWNDLDAALAHAQRAVELCRQWGNADSLVGTLITLAWIQSERDLKQAWATFQELEEVLERRAVMPGLRPMAQAFQARLWLMQGHAARAAPWAEARATHVGIQSLPDLIVWPQDLLLARVRLAQGQPDKVLKATAALLAQARAANLVDVIIKAQVLQAQAYTALQDSDAAWAALSEALTLAEPEGYVRSFVDEGEPLRLLISDFRFWVEKSGRGTEGDNVGRMLTYADKLLFAFSNNILTAAPQSEIKNLKSKILNPLSERELEVLRLAADGLSNREIADRLCLAESTVKSHLNTIFRKLDAKNRTQAVAQARQLGLI